MGATLGKNCCRRHHRQRLATTLPLATSKDISSLAMDDGTILFQSGSFNHPCLRIALFRRPMNGSIDIHCRLSYVDICQLLLRLEVERYEYWL